MDASAFDRVTRSFTLAGPRRRALGGLLAGTLGILGWHDGDEVAAHNAKKRCKKKSGEAKKKCLKKARKHNRRRASCGDGVKNGGESDIDCGGPTCPRCALGQACRGQADCGSAFCVNNVCSACTAGQCGAGCACAEGSCVSTASTIVDSCAECPADSYCATLDEEPECFPPCGSD